MRRELYRGITNALLGNYSLPVELAMTNMASSIVSQLIPNKNDPASPVAYLNPFLSEYNKRAYDSMENAVFKSCFHGKCQDPVTGIDPAGCPNPDCPVICGTPGSIVHFYPKFRYIAFNDTVNLMNDVMDPSSSAYQQVEEAVVAAASSKTRRRSLRFMRSDVSGKSWRRPGQDLDMAAERRAVNIKSELRTQLRQFRSLLNVVCGGTETGKTNDLPNCSWEHAFKQFILTFP
ncbi:hypothetical protein BDZ97DRAFT_2057316 [Flammula alnicola]|nr:hypothetical protein BDZ97DRAFT_2057316 [Flammula alnicola]